MNRQSQTNRGFPQPMDGDKPGQNCSECQQRLTDVQQITCGSACRSRRWRRRNGR